MSAAGADTQPDPVAFLRTEAPWLFAPELGTCVVGSQALAIACHRTGLAGPRPVDLDLAWTLTPVEGTALLQRHGVFVATTEGNQARGTLAMKVGGRRIEITTFRTGAAGPIEDRIVADLGERDMTIGALALQLANGRLHDPHDGLGDFRERRIAPVGDAAQRVREHPIRWLRYYRKAHELGFSLDARVRAIDLPPTILRELPAEAVALELRAILGKCPSPGRCLLELQEAALLEVISPELVLQFDGRPAGPQRWHPEVSQGLHLILALEWAFTHTQDLDERDAMAVRIAVLCHDLGKGYTRVADLPSHPGHEHDGLPHVERFLDRWPGFADQRARTLALHVCALHLQVKRWDELRAGTLAKLYDQWFRGKDYPVDLFARAVAADNAGRLGFADTGLPLQRAVTANLEWMRDACSRVDAGKLREQFPDDLEAFRAALHEARARAISAARRDAVTSPADEPRQ